MTKTNKKSKNTRKLLGAVGMLTVSAAMLVSSTFAWFSMNKKVTAQTMTIEAKSADPNILISANGGANWYNNLHTDTQGSEAANWTIVSPTEKLKLVTPTSIGSTMAWGWASSTDPNNAQKTNALTAVTMTEPTFTGTVDRSGYLQGTVNNLTDKFALYQELQIKNVSPNVVGNNLKITDVKINKGTNTIGNAVRLLFVVGDKYEIYEPAATGEDAVVTTATQVTGGTKFTDQVIDDAIAANSTEIVTVKVYMFFDGTDDDAYTNNASDLSGVSASFAFEIDPEIQTQTP